MMRRIASLALWPVLFSSLNVCAAPSPEHPEDAATPATYVFGSCVKKPAWPEAALREKREGAVELTFLVDADNSVLEARVKRSSGHPDLDEAARAALAKCTFKAATRRGIPVRGWVDVGYGWKH